MWYVYDVMYAVLYVCVRAKADTVSFVNCVQSAFLWLVKVRRFCCSL